MSISKMPFDVCCGGDIGTCKTLPIRRWEIFGCLAKFPRTNCNGGSRMTQFDGFRFMMCCVNPHVTNLMLANCNSTLGHQTTNLILLMRDSVWPLCV